MTIDNTANSEYTKDPSSPVISSGQYVPEKYPGIEEDANNSYEKPYGTALRGAIEPDGQVRIIQNGRIIAKTGAKEGYRVNAISAGAFLGQNVLPRDGTLYAEMKTESGGVASKDISPSKMTRFSPTFGRLEVGVLDANGDPVPKSKVGVGTTTVSTDSQGQAEVQAGGTVTVSALFGTVSKDVTLDADTDRTLSFQYHGVEGKVRTPTGGPIGGATVYLAFSDGSVFSKATSEDDGTFEFPTAPIEYDFTIASDPFARDFTTGTQGDWTTKNLPFNLETVGGVDLDLTDKDSGDPIAGLPTGIEDAVFSALSTSEGEASLIEVFDSKGDQREVTVEIGKDDPRYRTTTATVVMVAGDTVEATVDLERESAVVNT